MGLLEQLRPGQGEEQSNSEIQEFRTPSPAGWVPAMPLTVAH